MEGECVQSVSLLVCTAGSITLSVVPSTPISNGRTIKGARDCTRALDILTESKEREQKAQRCGKSVLPAPSVLLFSLTLDHRMSPFLHLS
jgi:hypothetical protein